MKDLLQQGIISELRGTPNVQYILNDKSAFALTEFKVLKSQNKHFIKCAKVLYNGKIKLIYFTSMYKSLRNMLPSLDGDTFLSIIANLLNCIIEIKNNGFLDCQDIDLSFDKVFVDQNTFEVNIIYLPLNSPNSGVVAFETELKTEIIKLISTVPAFANEKMTRVCGYLSSGTLSLNQLYGNICAEIKGGAKSSPQNLKNDQNSESKIFKQPALYFSSINTPADINFEINSNEYVIGKNPEKVNGVISFNKAISRVHCKISYKNNTYFITDLGSANGTFVNKNRLVANQPTQIKSGDTIRLANSDFVVRF